MKRTFELGEVIAERRLSFEADAGWTREVVVRLGRPVPDPSEQNGPWLCPYQVDGMGSGHVRAIFGVDSVQALVLAVHTIPAELTPIMREVGGRFLFHEQPETGFLRACRTTMETVGEYFPEESFQPSSQAHPEFRQRYFLNVDLDLESELDPRPLIHAMEPFAYSLERPPGRASFEMNTPVAPLTPDPLILEFVRLVKILPPDAADVWRRAERRTFDIGIQSLRRPFSENHRLGVETLRGAADVGAEIAFTVYALVDDERESAG